jgi:EAL domain-containing protein (putative c-di-GMP-specific phosphodiesterase class I)
MTDIGDDSSISSDTAAVDDQRRLEPSSGYELLDTAAVQTFDDLVALAASIVGVPIALISFVDTHRQWINAACGGVPAETDLIDCFSSHVIASGELLVVPDALQDTRFSGHPLVAGGPRIRFYAGAPLVTSDGRAVGTLSVMDRMPHELAATHETALRILSRYVTVQLDLHHRLVGLAKHGAERGNRIAELQHAMENQEFVLHYQPKIDLRTGHVAGVEALLRWNHPERGQVSPAEFVPLLEQSELILQVGRWVLNQALSDREQWLQHGLDAPRVAVNVSPVQLRHPDFVGDVEHALHRHGWTEGSGGLDIEITEGVLMDQLDITIAKLAAVRALGVRVAIDDFGTGYSSLRYLARLPIDALKIDRSFVTRMTANESDMTIVSSVIALAHALKLSVIAEGVETEAQRTFLLLLKCDELQGYLCGRPVDAREILQLLKSRGEGCPGSACSGDHMRRVAPEASPCACARPNKGAPV